ncbi:MAG: ATP-binding response regulator [Candidatus Nanopelagicales bacterium]
MHDQVTAELALVKSEREARLLAAQFEIASREAAEANLAKTAFLSRISHELRTPLNAILGFAQLLAMDPLTEDQREAVQHIRTGGKHLLELINEILDISRIEAGRLSLSMERVDVSNALTEALDLVRPLAITAGVKLAELAAVTDAESVWADRQRVIQIVLNLLTNAVKYNRVGGSITVTCERLPDGMIAIRVHDTGHGISEEYLSRLFQPFDRLGAEISSIEGTGIGLTLSEGLARAMSGRIEVESVVGVGSVFSLLLPSATLPETQTVATPLPSILMPGRRVQIQYIEDNPANLLLMTRIVALREGATLRTASGGRTGLAMVLADPPDLLLLDVHLQDLRGDEVLRQLRADPRTVDLPIVVITADASAQLRQRMMVLGASGFLTKPIEVREVLRWIDDPEGGHSG